MPSDDSAARTRPPPEEDDANVAASLDRLAVHHALIVADGPAVAAGWPAALAGGLPDRFELSLFPDAPPLPSEAAAREAAELFALLGCDGVIGVGGAAALTLASVVALLAVDGGPLARHLVAGSERLRLGPSAPLLLALPPGAGVPDDALLELEDGRRVALRCTDPERRATVSVP